MTSTGNESKKTCATCDRYNGHVCNLDGFVIGSIENYSCAEYRERQGATDSEKLDARQAITDKERREIAASLRQIRKKMDGEKPPQIPTLAAAVYLLRIAKAVKCGVSGALFYRLADLIDQPTCTFDGTCDRIGYVCSNCGQAFTRRPIMLCDYGDGIRIEVPFRYCPYCGAEVVW